MAQYEDKLERRRLTSRGKAGEWPRFKRMFSACMDELGLADAMTNKYAPDGAVIPVPGVADPEEPISSRTRRATMLRELEAREDWEGLNAAQRTAARQQVALEATEAANEDRKRVNRKLYNQLATACDGDAYHKLNGVPEFDGYEAWKALKRAYQQPTELRLTTLHQQLMTQEIGDKMDPEEYFSGVSDTLAELRENNIIIDENTMKRVVLANLTGKYARIQELFMYGYYGPEGYTMEMLKEKIRDCHQASLLQKGAAGSRRLHEGHFSGMPEGRSEGGGSRGGGNNNRFEGRGSGGGCGGGSGGRVGRSGGRGGRSTASNGNGLGSWSSTR